MNLKNEAKLLKMQIEELEKEKFRILREKGEVDYDMTLKVIFHQF